MIKDLRQDKQLPHFLAESYLTLISPVCLIQH